MRDSRGPPPQLTQPLTLWTQTKPHAGRPDANPRPHPEAAGPLPADPAPSRSPGSGLRWGHRPGYSAQMDPATLPPLPAPSSPETGEPGCPPRPTLRPHPRSNPPARDWDRSRITPGSPSDGPGRGSPAPATVGVGRATPQSPGSAGSGAGLPQPPQQPPPPPPAARWTLPALWAAASSPPPPRSLLVPSSSPAALLP